MTQHRFGNLTEEKLSCLAGYLPPESRNNRDTPLYITCSAAGNAKGAPTAVKIASSIIRKKQGRGRRP